MSDRLNPELKDRLREPVDEFVEYLKQNDELPENGEMYQFKEGKISTKEIPTYGNIANDYVDDPEGVFSDVIDWLMESGTGYNPLVPGSPSREREEEASDDDVFEAYTKHFVYFTNWALNYSEDYQIFDEDYELAFKNYFQPKYGIHYWNKDISPLADFHLDGEKLSLDAGLDLVNQDERTTAITKLEIGPPSPEELGGILTWSRGRPNIGEYSGRYNFDWSYVIRIERSGDKHSELPSIVFDMVLTALRLFQPKEAACGVGDKYRTSPNGLSHRESIDSFSSISPNNPRHRGSGEYLLDKSQKQEFATFWSNYKDWLFKNEGQGFLLGDYEPVNETISRAIRRFSQSHEKNRLEDAIIDVIIGFEGSILKDGGGLPERGAVLLEDTDSSMEYNFLKELWSTRHRIVHQDTQITDVSINGEDYSKWEFVEEARALLAKSVLQYIDLLEENSDKNITQINQEILQERISNRLSG